MKNGIKQKAFNLVCIGGLFIVVAVVSLFCWFRSAGKRTENFVSDGNGIQQASEQLERAGENQRETQKVTDNIAGTAANISAGITRTQDAVRQAEQSNADAANESDRAGGLIAECKSILAGVRSRGETDKAKN